MRMRTRAGWVLLFVLGGAVSVACAGAARPAGSEPPSEPAAGSVSADAPSAATAPAGAGADWRARIGPGGGALAVPAGATLAGVELHVPAAALTAEVELGLALDPSVSDDLGALAEQDPALFAALTSYLATTTDGAAHPLFGPVLLMGAAVPASPAIELTPAGVAFQEPVEVLLPASLVEAGPEEELLVLLNGGAGRWDVLDVEPVDGGWRVRVPHFSTLRAWRVLTNVLSNPTGTVDGGVLAQAQGTLAGGPLPQIAEALYRQAACGEATQLDPAQFPASLTRLLNYLGRDAGSVADVSDATLSALEAFVDDARRARVAAGERRPQHFVTMEGLFARALELTDGDVFRALAATHGVLRDNRTLPGQVGNPFQESLELVRGDGGDEDGARYHFFGMAIYSLVYEYQKDSGQLAFVNPAPETAARLEEAWVSGDIVTDAVEYAVDLEGAAFGRALYRHFVAAARGEPSPQAALCRERRLVGAFEPPVAETDAAGGAFWEETVVANRVALTLVETPDEPGVDARLEGTYVLRTEIPGEVLYGLFALFADAATLGLGEGDVPLVPPAFRDCLLIAEATGALTGVALGETVRGEATGTVRVEAPGCEDTDLTFENLGTYAPPAWTWEASLTADGLRGSFTLALAGPDSETPLTFHATGE